LTAEHAEIAEKTDKSLRSLRLMKTMTKQTTGIAHSWSRTKLRLRMRSLRGWAFVLVVAAFVGAAQLVQASQAATLGREIEQLKLRQEQLARLNAELEAEVARLRDPRRLEQRARELGFVPASFEQVEYLTVPPR
jgi:cell division protein FtsB